MKIAGFDWDEGNWPKCGKHGVSQKEIEEVFIGTPAVLADPFPGRGPEESHREISHRSLCVRGVHAARHRRSDEAAAYQRPLHAPEGDRSL